MSDRDTFGPRLRRERERRGITLDTIATVTRVGTDLWEGLESNDFSRWPSGIFARAFVRDYAKAVGLDADEVVDDFCRLFPNGDRRAARIIQGQAEIVGHRNVVIDDPRLLPPGGDRRHAARQRSEDRRVWRLRLAPRSAAAGIDAAATLLLASSGPLLFGAPFWASAGALGLVYFSASTVMTGTTPGLRAIEVLKERVPAVFTAHA
jgi:transcriptional regulator with XRE-family HTH domain